jgi:hypothetical protein
MHQKGVSVKEMAEKMKLNERIACLKKHLINLNELSRFFQVEVSHTFCIKRGCAKSLSSREIIR